MNGYPYQSFGNNYGGFNNSYNGYTGYGQTTPYQQPVVQPPKTNKIFVTSLDEALSRPAEPNTEIVYSRLFLDSQIKSKSTVFSVLFFFLNFF
jgi:hypothetical protein